MVHVGCIEELRDGSIDVGRGRRRGGRVREDKGRGGARRAVVVEIRTAAAGVRLSNCVVTARGSVGCATSSLPGELGCCGVPWVRDSYSGTFSGVI